MKLSLNDRLDRLGPRENKNRLEGMTLSAFLKSAGVLAELPYPEWLLTQLLIAPFYLIAQAECRK